MFLRQPHNHPYMKALLPTSPSLTIRRALQIAAIAAAPALGLANTYNYSWSTTGLKSMSHGTAYTWGLAPGADAAGKQITDLTKVLSHGGHIQSATMTITGLYDWIQEPADVLYINILNNVKGGIASYTHTPGSPSYDTTFGTDVFVKVDKPDALVKPSAPVKPTLAKPTAPKVPTLSVPVAPTPPPPNASTYTKNQYAIKLADYNNKKAAYDSAWAAYNLAKADYDAKKLAYDNAWAKYNTDKAAYDAALIAYNKALPAYNKALADYNKYAKTQAALGFDGVPIDATDGSIYDQAHSLLVADQPNGPGTWTDLDGPKTLTNLTITFTANNRELLESLLQAAYPKIVGFGFGPECHFYDKGVRVDVMAMPDTGETLSLFGAGALGLALLRRKLKLKKQT